MSGVIAVFCAGYLRVCCTSGAGRTVSRVPTAARYLLLKTLELYLSNYMMLMVVN